MNHPQDKVAFITGGAGGLGLALGRRFLQAGMKVVLADIRREKLLALSPELPRERTHLLPLDVTDRSALAAAAARTEELFGGVDVLCNNAGVNSFGPVDEAGYPDWDWILEVNLKGVVNGLVSFLPRIKARGRGGHVLNTSSIAALVGSSKAGLYAASKAAVFSLTESLWYDLAPLGIGVSLLCPGLVKTDIYKSHELGPGTGEIDEDKLREIHSVGMEPSEVADIAYQGMLRNQLHIFTHPEHQNEFLQRSERLLSAFPRGQVDPARLAFEESRRVREKEARERGLEALRDPS